MAGIFSRFNAQGMDEYVRKAREMPNALIVDVRSSAEFAKGHVKGAINIPAVLIEDVEKIAPDKDTPLFLHCLSGHRSGMATRKLKQMGYTNVTNMGGISRYTGALVKEPRNPSGK